MEKGVGYFTILRSEIKRIELTKQCTYLICKIEKEGVLEECLYEKISNPKEIDKINFSSELWISCKGNREDHYIVMEQCSRDKELITYYKVAKESNPDDWTYYKRRESLDNEI